VLLAVFVFVFTSNWSFHNSEQLFFIEGISLTQAILVSAPITWSKGYPLVAASYPLLFLIYASQIIEANFLCFD